MMMESKLGRAAQPVPSGAAAQAPAIGMFVQPIDLQSCPLTAKPVDTPEVMG